MAFPTIPTTASGDLLSSTTGTASTTHTFPDLTSLRGGAGPQAGDLLIAVCIQYGSAGSTGVEFSAWGAGFTETADRANATTNIAIGVAHKYADGTESGTFAVTSAGSFISCQFLMRIPAADVVGSVAPEVSPKTDGTTSAADPASFDPTNWAALDTLWISVCGNGETSTTGTADSITGAPTNYTGSLIVARQTDAVGAVTGAVAFRQNNTAAEDVGVWAQGLAHSRNAALVIAVKPGPATLTGAVVYPITFGSTTAGTVTELPRATTVARISLAPGTTPATRTLHQIRVRARTTTGSTGKINAALYEGATNRSGDLQSGALTNSLADYTLAIPDASAANITDYSDLEIRLWGSNDTGGLLTYEVAEVSLGIPQAAAGGTELFGAATQDLTAAFTTQGSVTTKVGAATQALTFGSTTQGFATKAAAATQDLAATFTTQGAATKGGAATQALATTIVTQGAATKSGAATQALTTTIVTQGTVTPASGAQFGAATQDLSFTSTTVGRVTAFAASTQALTFNSTTVATVGAFAQVVYPITFTSTTAGFKTTAGAVVLPLVLGSTAQGNSTQQLFGAATQALALGITTQGFATKTGAVVLPLTLTETTAGSREKYGAVVYPITFTSTTAGIRERLGAVVLPLSLSSTTQGAKTTQGAVVLPLNAAFTSVGGVDLHGTVVLQLVLDTVTFGQTNLVALLEAIYTGSIGAAPTGTLGQNQNGDISDTVGGVVEEVAR